MRVLLVFLAKIPAITIVGCAFESGWFFALTDREPGGWMDRCLGWMLAPNDSREIVTALAAIGIVYTFATWSSRPSFGVIVLATVVCVPVAFLLGILDVAVGRATQTGCLATTYASLLIPALLVVHDSACRRSSAFLERRQDRSAHGPS